MEEVQPDKNKSKKTKSPVEEAPLRKALILKNKRIEKGLSLDAVHEATKIPLDALKAIEEGYSIRILSPFYIKGFLKIYAMYLNVDPSEVIDESPKEKLPKVTKQDVDTDFEFNMQQTLKKYLTHQRKKQIAAFIGIILALFILFKSIVMIMHAVRNKPEGQRVKKEVLQNKSVTVSEDEKIKSTVKRNETKGETEKPIVKVPISESKPESSAKKQPLVPSPVVQSTQKDVKLTVRAINDSWLKVKADDKVVFQSTLNKGSVESWEASNEIIISGKNIINLEFEVNGKLIGALGKKDRKAKSVRITKDGLSVIN